MFVSKTCRNYHFFPLIQVLLQIAKTAKKSSLLLCSLLMLILWLNKMLYETQLSKLHTIFQSELRAQSESTKQRLRGTMNNDTKINYWAKMSVNLRDMKEYERRRMLAENVCKSEMKSDSFLRHSWDYYKRKLWFDNERRFVYCPNPKVGTTAISHMLLKSKNMSSLSGSEKGRIRRTVFASPPRFHNLRDAFKRYFSFVFVRHPLDRTVSAYYDKMLYDYRTQEFGDSRAFWEFQKNIVTELRGENFTADSEKPTEAEYIRGLWNEANRLGGIHKYQYIIRIRVIAAEL